MGEEDVKQKLLIKEATEEEEEELGLINRVWNESKKIWVVAGPAIFTRFSTFGTNVVSQAFIGHIGSTELAAYSLVFTVLVRFANGILVCVQVFTVLDSFIPSKQSVCICFE